MGVVKYACHIVVSLIDRTCKNLCPEDLEYFQTGKRRGYEDQKRAFKFERELGDDEWPRTKALIKHFVACGKFKEPLKFTFKAINVGIVHQVDTHAKRLRDIGRLHYAQQRIDDRRRALGLAPVAWPDDTEYTKEG